MVDIDWTSVEVRVLREALRYSPTEFARRVGVTKRTTTMWESAKTRSIRPASKRLLDDVLAGLDSSTTARFAAALPKSTDSPTATLGTGDEDDVRRRDALILGVGLATTLTEHLTSEPLQMLATLDSSSISPARLTRVEQACDRLGAQVVQKPPGQLLDTALSQFRTVRQALSEHQPTAVQTRLVRAGGQLANIVAEIMFNKGHFDHARQWYLTAIHAAEDIGDRYHQDIALAGLTYLPTYSNNPREVLDELTPRLAENPSHTPAAAWLWAMAARAHATLGEPEAFARCIDHATLALDRSPQESLRAGIFSFLPEKLAFYEATGHSTLGRVEQTAAAAGRALELYDRRETTEPALTNFELASALLATREVEHACAVATAALTDTQTFLGATVIQRARRFDAALAGISSPAVRQWRAGTHDITTSSTTAGIA